MKHFLVTQQQKTELFKFPPNRESAVQIISEIADFDLSDVVSFVTTEEVEITDDDVVTIETTKLTLQRYPGNKWGIVEWDVLCEERSPSRAIQLLDSDIEHWLKQAIRQNLGNSLLTECLQEEGKWIVQLRGRKDDQLYVVINVTLPSVEKPNNPVRLSPFSLFNGVWHGAAEIPSMHLLANLLPA